MTGAKNRSAEQALLPGALFLEQPALQLIYDTAPIGLAFLSPDCRYLQINQHLTEICGIAVEDHLGHTVRECVPALADSVEAIVRSIMATGEPVTGVEVAGQRPGENEHRAWITYWHPLRNARGVIVGVNVAAEEITEQKRREQHIRFILDELSHRTKNLLAVVIAVANQTARSAPDVKQYQERFVDRLHALADCHDLLVKDSWQGSSFHDLVMAQMRPFSEANSGRIDVAGPAITLKPDAVQNLGLAFHELATNASKHGALSGPHGDVVIHWQVEPASNRVRVEWHEKHGPPVTPPTRRGFGHVVIEQIVPRALNGSGILDFAPTGVNWTFEFPNRNA